MAAIRHAQVWMPTDIPSSTSRPARRTSKLRAGRDRHVRIRDEEGHQHTEILVRSGSRPSGGRRQSQVRTKQTERCTARWPPPVSSGRWALARIVCIRSKSSAGAARPIRFRISARAPASVCSIPRSIERPMPGKIMEIGEDSGWSWVELSSVDQTNGGAPLAHRDALKLLAAFIQHTDSKPSQQRLVCLDNEMGESSSASGCAHPFMMLNDVGRTFGKANIFNKDLPGSVDLKAWSGMSIWKDKTGCVTNMPKSMTGSLENPQISEEGRKFLAGLLGPADRRARFMTCSKWPALRGGSRRRRLTTGWQSSSRSATRSRRAAASADHIQYTFMRMKEIRFGLLSAVLVAGCVWHRRDNCRAADSRIRRAAALTEFTKRVSAYMELHKKGRRAGSRRQERTPRRPRWWRSKRRLGARIKAARSTAKQGDIFAPDVAPVFKSIFVDYYRRRSGREIRLLFDEVPNFKPQVNMTYPINTPKANFPPRLALAHAAAAGRARIPPGGRRAW